MVKPRDAGPGLPLFTIKVRGEITDRFLAIFPTLTVSTGHPHSTLTGALRDQAQLMGVLCALDGLGIELVCVTPQTAATPEQRPLS